MPPTPLCQRRMLFVLRGAKAVFVDIRPDTMNIDETLIEAAVTERTRAVVPVHYAGVACEMDTIMDIAKRHNLFVVEDAAQESMPPIRENSSAPLEISGVILFMRRRISAWARAARAADSGCRVYQ